MEEWLKSKPIVLKDEDDYALFERISPGIVSGHYLFSSRGKKAVEKARLFLREIFKTEDLVVGHVPKNKPHAKYLSLLVGFLDEGSFLYITKDILNGRTSRGR